jgi:DNA-binding transcriptional ArsR family regulator
VILGDSGLTQGDHWAIMLSNQMVTITQKRHGAVFRAIAAPTRRQILRLLRGRTCTVGEVAAHFRTSRPAISKHLRVLRSAGLVVTTRDGTARICHLNARPLRAVNRWLRDYEAFWGETLWSLKHYVEEDR